MLQFLSRRDFAVRLPNGSLAEVKFNGNNKHLAGLEMGKNPIGGAFGMTFGVPSDMWELIKNSINQTLELLTV